jgi:hypothetical protein
MKNALKKKKQMLEDQIAAQTGSNITPEKLAEFKETFKHFDKDNSGLLDKLELKACLQSLGQNFTVSIYFAIDKKIRIYDRLLQSGNTISNIIKMHLQYNLIYNVLIPSLGCFL